MHAWYSPMHAWYSPRASAQAQRLQCRTDRYAEAYAPHPVDHRGIAHPQPRPHGEVYGEVMKVMEMMEMMEMMER